MSVFHNINRYAIGFDHLMDHLVSLHSNNNLTTNEYPPYDIIKEGESNYKIELWNFFSNYYRVVIKLNFGFGYVRLFG